MPRPRKSIPSYRLHKASGQAVVTLDGHDVYLGRHDTKASRDAYERAVITWKAHGWRPREQRLALSVSAMIAEFWLHVEREGLYAKNGKPTSERFVIRQALRPLMSLYASMPAADFKPSDLRVVREAYHHRKAISRNTVNAYVHKVRTVFGWAVSMDLVPAPTWQALKSLPALRRGQGTAIENVPVKPANLRDVAKVLRVAPPQIGALIRLQWLTGARPGEVVQLRLGDIDRTGTVWIYRPGSHKTEHHGINREILLGPRAQAVLAPFLRADPGAYLFRTTRDEPMTPDAYQYAIRKYVRLAGVTRWCASWLRHNAATRFRRHRGLDAASTALGHSDLTMTQVYAERDRQTAIDLAIALG